MKKIEGNIIKRQVEAEELLKYIGEEVTLHGSIYKIRKMKGFSFVLLRTSRDVIQCVADEAVAIPAEESAVLLTAKIVEESRSKRGYELH